MSKQDVLPMYVLLANTALERCLANLSDEYLVSWYNAERMVATARNPKLALLPGGELKVPLTKEQWEAIIREAVILFEQRLRIKYEG